MACSAHRQQLVFCNAPLKAESPAPDLPVLFDLLSPERGESLLLKAVQGSWLNGSFAKKEVRELAAPEFNETAMNAVEFQGYGVCRS